MLGFYKSEQGLIIPKPCACVNLPIQKNKKGDVAVSICHLYDALNAIQKRKGLNYIRHTAMHMCIITAQTKKFTDKRELQQEDSKYQVWKD